MAEKKTADELDREMRATMRKTTPEQQRNQNMRQAEQNRSYGDGNRARQLNAEIDAKRKSSNALKPPAAPMPPSESPKKKNRLMELAKNKIAERNPNTLVGAIKKQNKNAIKTFKKEFKKPNTTGRDTPDFAEAKRQLREFGTAKDIKKVNKWGNRQGPPKKPVNFARIKALGNILGKGGKALGVAGFVPDIMKGGEAFSGKKKTNSSRFQG
jgi:hypothetical protein